MIDLVKIDGISYDVSVGAIQETAEYVEGSNKGTSLYKQRSIRDIAGIKYGHNITFLRSEEDPDQFDALFSYLFDNVRESVLIEVVHGQGIITYEAEYTTGTRAVELINDMTNTVYWNEFTVAFKSVETVINAEGV